MKLSVEVAVAFATLYLRKTATGQWEVASPRTAQFEVVRYSDGRGRVYHLPSERIALEGVHHLGGAQRLGELLDQWLADPQHCTIRLAP